MGGIYTGTVAEETHRRVGVRRSGALSTGPVANSASGPVCARLRADPAAGQTLRALVEE